MRTYTENGIRIIEADNGAFVTNGETYSDKVFLGKNADQAAWRDATAEEYEEWLNQKDEPDPTAEQEQAEALTRYANELTGSADETLTEATETLIKKVMEEK